MISQTELGHGDVQEFRQILNPQNAPESGAFKTYEVVGLQPQFIQWSDEESHFTQNVEIALCIHGWEAPDHKQAMSLIVLRFHLTCDAKDQRYETATIWFSFDDHTDSESPKLSSASPAVEAYAPFVKSARYNVVNAERKFGKSAGGEVGINYPPATAKATTNNENVLSYTRKYFDKGTATRIIRREGQAQRVAGVKWYLEQNKLQKFGVEPDFRVAILLRRQGKDNQIHPLFKGSFTMRLQAGFKEDFRQQVRKLFGYPEEKVVLFDPKLDDQVHGEDGKKLYALVDKDNLGRLASSAMLVEFSDVPGAALEPFNPKE